MINTELLKEKAADFNITLDEKALDRFDVYAEALVETNKMFNLTAITEPDDIVAKHFADSLSILKFVDIPQHSSLIDVGTGAGFPGLPLLIARPDLKVTFLDSTNKKLGFIIETLQKLSLTGETIHSRAEEAGQNPVFREKFDFATARAVAALPVLSEYCLPLIRINGLFIAMKASSAAEETASSENALKTLGGKVENDFSFNTDENGERHIISVRKISQTLPKYPRPSAQIAKKPLK